MLSSCSAKILIIFTHQGMLLVTPDSVLSDCETHCQSVEITLDPLSIYSRIVGFSQLWLMLQVMFSPSVFKRHIFNN